MSQRTLEILPTPDALAERAAELFLDLAQAAIAQRGRFTVALAGGSTPEKMYKLLARPEVAGRLAWKSCVALFGDERFVAHDDPRSNYGMARRALLEHVPIPEANVFPVPFALTTAADEAVAYESRIAPLLTDLDLLLLGLGDDGHTLSLFPGKPALDATTLVTWSPPGVLPPPVDRITLTYRAANMARRAVFLVSGAGKSAILPKVLADDADPRQYPAVGIRPTSGSVTWLVDAEAARMLAPGEPGA
jgi:6-phosphogluconolactonase